MIGTPASRWPLFLRRLACRFLGCTPAKLVSYDRSRVLVGTGCTRCELGEVRRYRTLGPLPHAVRKPT